MNCGEMIVEFANQVKTMRDLQRQYFLERQAVVLQMAKRQESVVDRYITAILKGQGELL